ncbi:MAG TPA: glycosyltransferase, partial [Spirochaetia bacterium]|nr:glycosyltransferase [Spirochaetia bacterium]
MIVRTLADAVIGILSAGIILVHLGLYAGLIRVAVVQRRGFRGSESRRSIGQFVSVVVPARNEEGNLPRLLASLDAQSVNDFQLVLIDDRSTDCTQQIM